MFLLWIQWMELKYKDGYLYRPMSHQHTGEPSKGSLGQKGPWEAESFLKQEVGHQCLTGTTSVCSRKVFFLVSWLHFVSTSTLELSASVFLLQT